MKLRWMFSIVIPLTALLSAVVVPRHGEAAETSSGCVSCHTDAAKLKTITDGLPKPLKSEETAGKG